MNKKNIPELLMPAGSKKKAFTAFKYGADAVYMGVPMFSLRTRENNVTESDIREILEYAKNNKKKVYVTVNGFPHEFAIDQIKKHLIFLEEVKPDGIIFADIGVLSLANEFAPSIAKHLSVQTSTVNIPAMKMWMRMGVERVILAREMSIREVAKIHKELPDLELEYFVHGAVCMAYSGRCLLSNFTGGRDANRGACNHTCRWNYKVFDDEGREIDVSDHEQVKKEESCSSKSIRDFEKLNFAEEGERKNEIIPIEEDIHGTHIMSSKDMCMIEDMEKIANAGVCSLKVEGRNKTEYYAATIARAYKKALKDFSESNLFDERLWDEIHATANRGFFPGFLNGKPRKGSIQYESNKSTAFKEYCGEVISTENNKVEIIVKNKIDKGSEIEVVMPNIEDDFSFIVDKLFFGNKEVEVLHGGNNNKSAYLVTDKILPNGVFLRQRVKNPGLKNVVKNATNSYKIN
jgi:putative protease